MRRLALVCLLLAIVFAFSFSQGLTELGVKGGLNLATFSGTGARNFTLSGNDPSMLVSYEAGAFATYALNSEIAIQPEVYYSVKGAKDNDSRGGIGATAAWKISYLEVPILGKYVFPEKDKTTLSVYTGPDFAYIVSGKQTISVAGVESNSDVSMKNVDFGWVIGAGFVSALELGKVTVDLRYTLGLSNVITQVPPARSANGLSFPTLFNSPTKVTSTNIKNGVISILVGYSFI